MSDKKIRLDTYLFNNKLAPSREKAKAIIMSGIVYVDNQKLIKQAHIFIPIQRSKYAAAV